ncbi:hypothetical protein BHE74_00002986 [Ensete ventricosum]|nr:hypothetical protein BHE74_00002986 [Ensete ventricosum]
MKNSWNDMILLLLLQEFMSLTSVQGKLCASAFNVDSLHAAITKFYPSCFAHRFALS